MNPGFLITEMGPEDVKAVAELEAKTFSSPWPPHSFIFAVQNSQVIARVARSDRILAAYIISVLHEDHLLIANLAVSRSFRRQGLAARLLKDTLQAARSAGLLKAVLDVRESNYKAIRLYLNFGFRIVAKKSDYYSRPPEDAFVMQLAIPKK